MPLTDRGDEPATAIRTDRGDDVGDCHRDGPRGRCREPRVYKNAYANRGDAYAFLYMAGKDTDTGGKATGRTLHPTTALAR